MIKTNLISDDDEPIIYHGHTLTSKILFKDVIATCKEFAFETTKWPVILSIENHASKPVQIKMAAYLREILGSMLVQERLGPDLSTKWAPEGGTSLTGVFP